MLDISQIEKQGNVKIELGAGSRPRMSKKDNWLFNDIQPLSGIDLVAPCNKLGLHANTVDAFYTSHMLEHIWYDQIPNYIMYWHKLLKVGGSIEIIVPNAKYAMEEFIRCSDCGEQQNSMIFRILYGTRNAGTDGLPPYNEHHIGFTDKTLKGYLSKAGFTDIKVSFDNRFGIPNRDIHAIGYK